MAFTHENTYEPFPELPVHNINGLRFYEAPNGKKYPSITTVLGKQPGKQKGLQQWRERIGEEAARIISGKAARRGTAFHNICEDYINNQDIEQMQLQGGEPQLMKGFVDIITQIDSKKRSQIGLQVTTNASIFNEKFWEQAVKFQRVIAGISIDATGSRYDVIRYHGDWGTTEKNCIKILDHLWTNRINPGPNPALNLNIVLQLANVDQCDAMNSFYEDLQKHFPGLAFQYCLAHINDLDTSNRAWDIQNLPLEILNSLPNIKTETQLVKQWREGIDYAIENNGYNKNYKCSSLVRTCCL